MTSPESIFRLLDIIGVVSLVAVVSFVSVQATCPPGPRMRRKRAS